MTLVHPTITRKLPKRIVIQWNIRSEFEIFLTFTTNFLMVPISMCALWFYEPVVKTFYNSIEFVHYTAIFLTPVLAPMCLHNLLKHVGKNQ